MDLRLLQYNVGSHSRKGEVVKQQLVQTALEQGLCDLALLTGCTGIHEPVRAGAGAMYQPAFHNHGHTSSNKEAGTLVCYTAERFKARQLATCLEDLPGCQHSIFLLEDTPTGTHLIAIVLSIEASSQPNTQHPSLARLWHLMHELSTQCPVLVAGECTISSEASPLCSDPLIQLHLCKPVQEFNSISQSFFATACHPPSTASISDVSSLLARPAAAAVQYTHNAHTATCHIRRSEATAADKSAGDAISQNGSASDRSGAEAVGVSSALPIGSGVIAEKLQALVNAASMGATEASRDGTDAAGNSCIGDLHGQRATCSSQDPQLATGHTATSCSQPAPLMLDGSGQSTKQTAPAPLLISQPHVTAEAGCSEIEPKPPTPAARPTGWHQLTQTSSGNLCLAGSSTSDSALHQLPEAADSMLLHTPKPFQLQPRPTGQQHIDISTLRIMQLKRSISELSSGNAAADPALSQDAAALTSDLHAMLTQQRHQQQLSQPDSAELGRPVSNGLLSTSHSEGSVAMAGEGEEGDTLQSGSGTDAEDDTGLYAAAKQAPDELRAAWNKLVQQPVERKSMMRRQGKGRNSEDKMTSPGRLLRCLQTKTDSDVEAQMETMRFKH